MLKNLRERRGRGEGGFTLIELLLVIIILGILAGIVVFSVRGVT
ncbi:prepilin-type N-terminal cleavage/methylation domain-containing protein, partial [Citrobacter sp. AAK_AS5]